MSAVPSPRAFPARPHPSGWWGMVLLIATEATLFVLLIAAYFYLRVERHGGWPPGRLADPAIPKPLLANLILVASCAPLAFAGRSIRAGRTRDMRLALAVTVLLGIVFLLVQVLLVRSSLHEVRPQDNAYGSIYYTLIGVHFVHVLAGALGLVWAWSRSARFTRERHLTLVVTSLYWYFVSAAAVVVFLTLYVAPRG